MSRILVADDEPHIRKLVSFTLENRGYEVLQATDGGEAYDMARAETPDLIYRFWDDPGDTRHQPAQCRRSPV